MKPNRSNTDFERVRPDEWISGIIAKVERDPARKSTYKGEDRIVDSVRFVFSLEGYKFNHFSRWMTFSYSEKSTLLTKYLIPLVQGAKKNFDFDLEQLKGMAIKTMWSVNGDWDNLELIRPLKSMVIPEIEPQDEPPMNEAPPEDDIPFGEPV
jgi:hypothetical protein